MRKLLRVSIGALLLLAVPLLAFAGAVGDWGAPHLNTIQLQRFSSAPNVIDSLSFYLEGSTKPNGSGYDTTSTIDTLSIIDLSDNAAWTGTNWINKSGTASVGDSIFVGRLTVTTDPASGALGSADSLFVITDSSPDGVTWVRQAVLTGETGKGGYVRLNAVPLGGRDVWVKDLYSNSPLTKIAAVGASNATICPCYGARALRFRLGIGVTSAVKKVQSVTWTYLSNAPSTGKQN